MSTGEPLTDTGTDNLTEKQVDSVIDSYCSGKSPGKLKTFRDKLIKEQEDQESVVIPIASGKGGVGKTNIAVALALALTDYGHNVGLFDLDMASNTHYLVGLNRDDIRHTLVDFLETDENGMADVVHHVYPDDETLATRFENLHFFPGVGAGDEQQREMSQMINYQQYRRLLRGIIDENKYDFILMDLPAGTDTKQVTFYSPYQAETTEVDRLISRGRARRCLVLNYSPNSYEASMIFLEHLISRDLKIHFENNEYVQELKNIFREKLRNRMSKQTKEEREHIVNSRFYFELIQKAGQYRHEIGEKLEEYLRTFDTHLICNAFGKNIEEARQRYFGEQYHVGEETEWNLGLLPDLKPDSFCKYFSDKYQFEGASLELEKLGYLPRNAELVSESERKGRSLYTEDTSGELTDQVKKMAQKLKMGSSEDDPSVTTNRSEVLSQAIARVNHHINQQTEEQAG